MELITTVANMVRIRPKMAVPFGLVPTMGYLHEGHIALIRKAKEECATVAVSVFVNPHQFGPNEDLDSYPRDLDRDLRLLKNEGIDIVFHPSANEVYPLGFDTSVEVGGVAKGLEGTQRPGHFLGVATVVTKLFNIVGPNKAYFGQKDGQQVAVVKRLVEDLNLRVEIVVVPTVREADGLAKSSRNVYLETEEREAASVLWRSLSLARDLWSQGIRNAETIRVEMGLILNEEPLASVDYISIADVVGLQEVDFIRMPVLVSVAVHIGRIRLIDNIVLDASNEPNLL